MLDDKMTPGLKKAGGSLGRFESGLGRTAQGLGKLQTGVVRAGTRIAAGLAVGAAGAAKVAADFQSSFAGIQKTVDEGDLKKVGLSFDVLRKSILDMSTEIPVAATTLADIGAEAGALGIRAQDITSFTEVVAKLGVTTNLSTDAASSALGHLGTILGLTGDDFDHFADTLVNLGNKGASTESDIIGVAERFASAGSQAGLTTNQILGMSSALASLRAGGNIEASGGAMSRVFSGIATQISLGSGKAKVFGRVIGMSLKDMTRMINNKRGLPLFLSFLKELRTKTPVQQARLLDKIGIRGTRDADAIRKLAQNYDVLTKSLNDADQSQGALDVEAQTRFDTLNSKIGLLKNNLIRVGIEAGDGVLPGITRATDKLTGLLKDPEFLASAREIGKELGDAIDSVDWNEVLDTAKGLASALKPALDITLSIAKAFNALPGEIKGAALAIIGINKLSGGLISSGLGDIVGGLGEAVAKGGLSRVPGVSSIVATPVRVVNWPVGGVGGGVATPGATGGMGLASKVFLVGEAIGLAAAVKGVQQEISDQNTAAGKGLEQQLKTNITVQSPQDLKTSLAAVEHGIAKLENPLLALVAGDSKQSLETMRADLITAIQHSDTAGATAFRDAEKATSSSVDSAGDTFDRATSAAKLATVAALGTVGGQVSTGTTGTTNAVTAGAAAVAAAVRAATDIINISVHTNVTASDIVSTTVNKSRQGPSGGSRDGGSASTGNWTDLPG